MTRFHIGTSGWHYKHWSGDFYPAPLPTSEWLRYYVQHFSTVELNASFYRLPRPGTWRMWGESVPRDFRFAVKASRYITHIKRLDVGRDSVDRFFEGALQLGPRLGPVLYQLPPSFERSAENVGRLARFANLLPGEARHIVEFRHSSWFIEQTFDELRDLGLGFCAFHMPELESPLCATTPTGYMRFHGSGQKYGGAYGPEQLEVWAAQFRKLNADDVYIYFNNDIGGHAPRDAALLQALLAPPTGQISGARVAASPKQSMFPGG